MNFYSNAQLNQRQASLQYQETPPLIGFVPHLVNMTQENSMKWEAELLPYASSVYPVQGYKAYTISKLFQWSKYGG